MVFQDDLHFFDFFNNGVNSVVIPMVVIVSLLMVSSVEFEKIPRFDKDSLRDKKWSFVLFFLFDVDINKARLWVNGGYTHICYKSYSTKYYTFF